MFTAYAFIQKPNKKFKTEAYPLSASISGHFIDLFYREYMYLFNNKVFIELMLC